MNINKYEKTIFCDEQGHIVDLTELSDSNDDMKETTEVTSRTEYEEYEEQDSQKDYVPDEQEVVDKIWGNFCFKADYNEKRESVEINCRGIIPDQRCLKIQDRVYFFQVLTNGLSRRYYWNSGHFVFRKRKPPMLSWSLENLTPNINNCTLTIDLYRQRLHLSYRLISNGEIKLSELCFCNNKTVTVPLQVKYVDKPKINPTKSSNKTKESTIPHEEVKPKVHQNSEDAELRVIEFCEPSFEILLGIGYNKETSLLLITVREVFVPNIRNKDYYSKMSFQVQLSPENITQTVNSISKDLTPFERKKFAIFVPEDTLSIGTLTVTETKKRKGKDKLKLIVDRSSDDHWVDMLINSPEITYMWHELC